MAGEYDSGEFIDTDFTTQKSPFAAPAAGPLRAPSREDVDRKVVEAQQKLVELKRAQEGLERERSALALRELESQIRKNRPLSELEQLEHQLRRAIDKQEFERAARLRDRGAVPATNQEDAPGVPQLFEDRLKGFLLRYDHLLLLWVLFLPTG